MQHNATLGLVPAGDRQVRPVPSYLLALVPPPTDNMITVKPSVPDVESDTMPLIINKAKRTAYQVKKLAAKLKGNTISQTLRNNSDFILKHIKYVKDAPNHEQIRSPRRLIHEGKGDCDCFAVTLAALLINQGIKFRFRIAQYASNPGTWAHIYIVVPTDQSYNGPLTERDQYTVLDPVTNLHNHEVTVLRKRDYTMALQFLDGIGQANMGACAKEGVKVNPVTFTTRQNIAAVEMKKTTDVLDKAGIDYLHNLDENNNPSVVVNTPKGAVKLPTTIDTNQVASLTQTLTQAKSEATPENIQSEIPISKTGAAAIVASVLALAWWSFSGSGSGNLNGPPKIVRKKLSVIQL